MTTAELTHAEKTWAGRGYLPVDEVRDRVSALAAADINLGAVAEAHGLARDTLSSIARGRRRFVSPETAAKIAAIDLDEATDHFLIERPYLDEITLDQIVEGALRPTINSIDKPLYARALSARGWTKSRIARVLRMSGGKVSEAVRETA